MKLDFSTPLLTCLCQATTSNRVLDLFLDGLYGENVCWENEFRISEDNMTGENLSSIKVAIYPAI